MNTLTLSCVVPDDCTCPGDMRLGEPHDDPKHVHPIARTQDVMFWRSLPPQVRALALRVTRGDPRR